MNTLLGEVATLNDVQYHRYRIAFKFRKLQKNFYLDHLTITTLQDVFHQTGVQGLPRTNEVFLTQLRSTLNELYSSLRVSKPLLRGGRLQLAQEQLFNWLQMAYKSSSGSRIEAGSLKLTLALFTGSNAYDKARYFFSVLTNMGGAVDVEGIGYFLSVTQQLGSSVQEHLYPHWQSAKEVFRDCLRFVRAAEDLEDQEEWDGSFRNQFLSQFEFTKLFTTLPEPEFLCWMALWHRLPTMEKVIHSVRCSVCTRKPIIAFRYQCTQCPSYNLCQMCFLKGRTTDKHLPTHKMLEFTAPTKGHWHHRLLGLGSRNRGGRLWTEPKEPFIYSPRNSVVNFLVQPSKKKDDVPNKRANSDDSGKQQQQQQQQVDTPINSITEMINDSQETVRNSEVNGSHSSHQPAVIRIGSGDTPTSSVTSSTQQAPPANPLSQSTLTEQTQSSNRSMYSSSPDSVSSGGQRFNYEGPLSCASSDLNATRSSLGNLSSSTAGSEGPMYHVQHIQPLGRYRSSTMASAESALPQDLQRPRKGASVQRSHSYTSRDRRHLVELNKRLSIEVDHLLSELPSDYPPMSENPVKSNTQRLHKLHMEERSLQNHVNRLRNQRERLAGELQGLISQVQHMHSGFVNMTNGVRTPSPPGEPLHGRYASAPSQIYPTQVEPPKITQPSVPVSSQSQETISSNSRLHRHAHLLDPLVEFTPDQLNETREEAPENYRLSVAW